MTELLLTELLLTAMLENNIDLVLSNPVKCIELFGHIVIAWMWLKQGVVANRKLVRKPHQEDEKFYLGKLQAMKYIFRFELPKIKHWTKLAKQSRQYNL